MASYATTTSNQPADALPKVYVGSTPPSNRYRLAGVDADRRRAIGQSNSVARGFYDSYQQQRQYGNLSRSTPPPMLPAERSDLDALRWELADDEDKPSSDSGSAAKPPEQRPAEQRITPPSQSARNALDRSLQYLNGSVQTPDLDNTSNPGFYRQAAQTYSRNADRVDRRYADYFDKNTKATSAEIGFAGAQAVAGLPGDLAMTEPIDKKTAIAFAKDLSLIATGQYNRQNASPQFWTGSSGSA